MDEFQVLSPLGSGGMGHVYLGRDTVLERPVALKFIAGEPDLALRGRFLIEARAIARLSHPNVVAIYRIGDVLGRPYIAYEFVEGRSLDQLPRPVPWTRAFELALGLARGLAAAHRAGITHRDIKPGNVMVSVSGTVKLLDFGLAKLALGRDSLPPPVQASATPDRADTVRLGVGPTRVEAKPRLESSQTMELQAADDGFGGPLLPPFGSRAEAPASMHNPPLTAPGLILGTPLYAAPEVWTGDSGMPSDVYSLGLVLHELCTGLPPRGVIGPEGRLHDPATRDPAPLRFVAADMPEAFTDIVDRCLRRIPSDRFASGVELCDALEDAESLLRLVKRSSSAPAGLVSTSLVSASFARIERRALLLTEDFYRRLFDARPDLRPLFPEEMSEQKLKLAGALELAIEHLQRPERLTPLLEELGRRHARYGVRAEDFTAVGSALVASLAAFDREHWSPSLEAAWTHAYQQVADSMLRGLTPASPTPRQQGTS